MFEIEKGIPIPRRYMGRKSKHREAMTNAMRSMNPGDSFRVEYKLTSMRNVVRNAKVEGSFRVAQEDDTHVRVWKID